MIDNYDCPARGATLAPNPITHPMANGDGKSKSVEITNWIREVPQAPLQNIHQRMDAPVAPVPGHGSSSFSIQPVLLFSRSSPAAPLRPSTVINFTICRTHNYGTHCVQPSFASRSFTLASRSPSRTQSLSSFLLFASPSHSPRLHSVNNRRRQQQ